MEASRISKARKINYNCNVTGQILRVKSSKNVKKLLRTFVLFCIINVLKRKQKKVPQMLEFGDPHLKHPHKGLEPCMFIYIYTISCGKMQIYFSCKAPNPENSIFFGRVVMEYLYTQPFDMSRSTHYGNNYWIFYSRKVGRRVTAFSNLEYENLISLEMDSNIEFYCEQPCKQTVNIDGRKYDTVFDVYVVYKDGREEFQEVKYQEELDSKTKEGERSRRQIDIQTHWCKQNDYAYSVRTDKDIHIGQYTCRNLSILCAKSRRFNQSLVDDKEAVIRFLRQRRRISINQLLDSGRLSSKSGFDLLADLYFLGIIDLTDIDNNPLDGKTEVIIYGKQEIRTR